VRDIVLHREYVAHVAIIGLRPQMKALSARTSCAVMRMWSPDFRTLPSSTCVTPSVCAISPIVVALPLNENEEVRAGTRKFGTRVRTSISSSARPSEKYS